MKTIYFLRYADYEIEEQKCLQIRLNEIVFEKYTHSRISNIGVYYTDKKEAQQVRELYFLSEIQYYEKDIEMSQNKLKELKSKLGKI